MRNPYTITQSPLYRLGSKTRLAKVLKIDLQTLLAIAVSGDSNYRIFTLPEEVCIYTGKVKRERAVQQPKRELNKLQERIKQLLMRIEPPSFAHAAVKGRSYRTNALAHAEKRRVATFDISSFYSATSASRVYSFFREQLLCAPDVAKILTQIACYGFQLQVNPIALPTGSALSPILSLYANGVMFEELNKLALKHDLLFTCYVDDLTFSGDVLPYGLPEMVQRIIYRHGHTLSIAKTRIFCADQSKHVTGVVLKDGIVKVPYSRFKKARRLDLALSASTDTHEQRKLIERLAGLLGEASHLDVRYKPWASRLYGQLRRT